MAGITRRHVIRAGALGALGLAAASTLRQPLGEVAFKEYRVGFIYVGARDDFGYNQALATAAARLGTGPGITLLEQDRIPETSEVAEVMRYMIEEEGAEIIFPTSFGYYDPYVLDLARAHPEVHFIHAGGLYQPGHPENISTFFGYTDEGMYLAGIVAGHMSKTGRLGLIAAMDIPHVHRNVNAYLLGARRVNPYATLQVRFTGNWFDPLTERQVCEEMIAAGSEIITCHVDSPQVIVETCATHDRYCIGYHSDLGTVAPDHVLTSVQWDWWPVFAEYLQNIQNEIPLPNMKRAGLRESVISLAPFGRMVTPEAKQDVSNVLHEFMQSERMVYSGPIYNRSGEVIIPEGVRRSPDDPWLETMDWFVMGVQI